MSTEELFSIAAFLFLAAGLCGFVRKALPRCTVTILCAAALALLGAGFFMRWHYYAAAMNISWFLAFPVSTFYESVVFFVACVAVIALFYLRKGINRPAVAAVCLICGIVLLLLNFSAIPQTPVLFLPSLKSYWLVAHVALSFVAYAMFALAAVLGLRQLFSRSSDAEKTTALSSLIRKLSADALLIFTVGGLIFGAVWAHHSWGRFWAWDPKETWAFVTWCAYVLMLHTDWRRRLSDKVLAFWAVANFGIVLFTYFGVSVLFAGLHSYISLPEAL